MSLLVKKLAARARRVLRLSDETASAPNGETWVSSLVDQLIQENVSSVQIVCAAALSDEETDTVVARLRFGSPSINIVRRDLQHHTQFAGFDCIVIRNSSLFSEIGIDAVNSARVLVVCETESFHGYDVVSRVLSRSDWELIGTYDKLWDACVVFRRLEFQARGTWDILDALHPRAAIVGGNSAEH